ncbi:nucleoside-diphosphate kinase [Lentisphaerota bacterium ZTH]|nr:nucleoside-diphosphate kinase [Lentisphaerota bacterium]WET05125.1 nucleoside-diphosphate kinase [Lentisphaerota bacterium ZTH]
MSFELSYVLITPYSLMKSRTGGILARLLSRTDLDFTGARVLTFSRELAERYAQSLHDTVGRDDPEKARLLSEYVLENFTEHEDGKKERVLMLLFKGEDACAKLSAIAGKLNPPTTRDCVTGETIRDTYADMVFDKDNPEVIRYFEPAVLTPPDMKAALEKLKMFADFADKNENVVENVFGVEEGDERTLVIIKPDNWRHPSSRPGNIIDMLSRTGLRIVGCKVYRMSVGEALEFYGPVQEALRKKLAPKIGEKAKEIIEKDLDFKLNDSVLQGLTESVGKGFADDQFSRIVEFMSGRRPEECPESELGDPGLVKCLILIYEGKDAINKIRTVLGPTDPTKAPGGTIRRDFGSDVMVNTAHASDSRDSVKREMQVVKIKNNRLSQHIYEFLEDHKG